MRASSVALVCLLLASCAGPPPSAYVGGSSRSSAAGIGLGTDAAGEACTAQPGGGGAVVFCGKWDQPSGHVLPIAAPAADLQVVALSSPWRNTLDTRYDCGAPTPTSILGDTPALLLGCTRKVGGWPQIAMVAAVDGRVFAADGIRPALPVLERAIGVLSGRVSATDAPALPPGQADAIAASRLAAQSFGAGDIGQYQQLMVAGTRANLAESFVPAESAYRAAYALQTKALGRDDPNTGVPLMLIALQLSDQGRTAEADDDFARAEPLVARAADPTALPRLEHYRALNALNEGRPADALPLLQRAEAGYAALLPPEMLAARPAAVRGPIVVERRYGGAAAASNGSLLLEPDQQTALIGVIETRRYEAITLRELGRTADAQAAIQSAQALATSHNLTQRDLTARLYRTASLADDLSEKGSGYGGMQRAARDFGYAQPGTRPLAQTELLRAAQELRAGSVGDALTLCRRAAALLRELKAGTSVALVSPCLSAYATAAAQDPAHENGLFGEMFATSQLVQNGITAQQIALASARLIEGAKDPKVAEAIRRQQDASLTLANLQRQADAQTADSAGATSGDLAKQTADAQAALADADGALQAAAPNYGGLVQAVVSADDVLAALAPGEAFASMTLGPDGGWVFVLRDGTVTAVPTTLDLAAVTGMVKRIRATVEPTDAGVLPAFDVTDAQALYAGTLGRAAKPLTGATSLTVAPVGPLLSLPFSLLLTGPATPDALGAAPWLVRQYAITHVPAPASFVSLRRVAAASRASEPYYGFGDFRPVTLTQAERTFPTGACEDSAKLFADLPPLPFARKELTAARLLMGGAPQDELEGPGFNTPAVLHLDLRAYRVLHFATHALLPTDLRCESEPAIVTSDPPGAPDARGALMTASDVTGMQLDADVVILSACNTGGPNGATSGESLSGLARAFFYAGARSLMVTHWSVNDQATALLVAGTLQRLRAGDPLGVAGALRGAQTSMLAEAGHGLPAEIAHPFYWAPFALVGEGRGRTVTAGL